MYAPIAGAQVFGTNEVTTAVTAAGSVAQSNARVRVTLQNVGQAIVGVLCSNSTVPATLDQCAYLLAPASALNKADGGVAIINDTQARISYIFDGGGTNPKLKVTVLT